MISTVSKAQPFRVQFSDGQHLALADTTKDKGGGEAGFRPHELLEAALATCMNMAATMYAAKHAIPLTQAVTKVTLDRSGSEQVVFRYSVDLSGELTAQQKEAIMSAIRVCPVRKTLSRGVRFLD
jgi:putative redox protein